MLKLYLLPRKPKPLLRPTKRRSPRLAIICKITKFVAPILFCHMSLNTNNSDSDALSTREKEADDGWTDPGEQQEKKKVVVVSGKSLGDLSQK